jgi:hypothetical protein
MALLSSSDYPAIRAAIRTSLDERDLPDAIIALDIYSGEANRWAASQITITGPEATGQRANSAAIYYAAALLAPAVEQVTNQKDSTGESLTLKDFDAEARAKDLMTKAQSLINLVNGALVDAIRPTSAVRQMKSKIIVCQRCGLSACCCQKTVLIF